MENKNKKIVVPTIVAVLTLVILTVGAAYAYFTVSTTNSFGTKTITATTPSVGSVALTSGTNLTMNVTASQMMAGNSDIIYYASENGTTTTETTETIGTATVTGEGTFSCDYTLTIDDNSNSLYDAFQSMSTKSAGQIVLSVNEVEYDFNTTNLFPKTISGTMNGLTSSNPKNITAQLKLVNKINVDQSALAGKTLTLSFNVSNFKCNATEDIVLAAYLLENPTEGLNTTLQGNMYRYQGDNDSVDNYICFGTSDKDNCLNNQDKYMYRIIGINESSQVKLIKKEALDNTMQWWTSLEDVPWYATAGNKSLLYTNLNGNDFLNNTTYIPNGWKEKIADVSWKYGDTGSLDNNANYTTLYNIEKAWSNVVSSKIALMYASDYLYSYPSANCMFNWSNNCNTAWMYIGNNDSNTPSNSEWTMNRQECSYESGNLSGCSIISVEDGGGMQSIMASITSALSVRPVFYLESNTSLVGGTGLITDPLLIK